MDVCLHFRATYTPARYDSGLESIRFVTAQQVPGDFQRCKTLWYAINTIQLIVIISSNVEKRLELPLEDEPDVPNGYLS